MPADNRHVQLFRLLAFQLSHEGVGTDDIQRGHAKQFVFVVNTGFLQHFCRDCHGGVYRVGDNADAGFRAGCCHLLDQITHDACVDIEQI
ncbi:hypothetical protein D3C74_464600 [compost metagenome]